MVSPAQEKPKTNLQLDLPPRSHIGTTHFSKITLYDCKFLNLVEFIQYLKDIEHKRCSTTIHASIDNINKGIPVNILIMIITALYNTTFSLY